MLNNVVTDIAIGVLGILTLGLLQKGKVKLASITGLVAQPFWLFSAYNTSQWGMFFICCIYTVMYIKGLYGKLD